MINGESYKAIVAEAAKKALDINKKATGVDQNLYERVFIVRLFKDANGYNQVDIPAALESLRQAAELDSSYALPLIHSALLSFYLGACGSAAALAGRLQQRPLTTIERWQVERELARCRGDFPASYRLSRRLVEASPGSDVMTFALIRDAMQIDRPREALDQSRRLDPERSVVRNRMSTHVFIETAYHWIGDHRRELRVARGSRRLAATSDPAAPVRAELVALAALGRIPELNARLDAFSEIAAGAPTGFPPARRYAATVIRETALELTAHGHPREGAS